MGWPITVLAWTPVATGGYEDVVVFEGTSLVKAILAMRRARKYSGCVTLKVRG